MRCNLPVIPPVLRGPLAALIVALALAGAATGHAADLMKKQPYLIYPGDPTHMQVLWQLTATATSTLEWGTDTTCALGSVANAEYGSDHQHAWTITGLTPGTKHFYRVTTDGIAYRGSFNTAPNLWATKLKFLAYGDTRTYPATHNQVAGAMLSSIAADPAFQSLVLFMGDYVTTGTSESLWTSEFFDPTVLPNVRQLMANTTHQGAIGNHEGTGTLFVKYLPYPFEAGRYWSFDYGPIHVTVVDQYTSYAPGSAQLQWIVNDLASTNKTWKFILLHEPGWSAYGGHPNNTLVQAYLQPLCLQYGVSIVFGGHNHYYSRATVPLVTGVQHLTTGGGGAPLETPDIFMPYIVASARANHHCTIAIDGDTLWFKAINTANGAVLDSFTLQRPASAPDSTLPSVAISAPDGGETWKAGSVHTITWSATDDVGVSAVDLAYSTDGGATFPFLIARWLANSGSCSWTVPNAVSNGVRVRVTARDSIGNVSRDASAGDFTIDNWIIHTSAGAGGSILPGGDVPVLEGANQSFSIRPATNFVVATLTADGDPVTPDTTYTFPAVAAHHSIAATFMLDPRLAVGDGSAVDLFLARPLPDPSVGSALLRFGLPAAGRVRLEILDLAGRRAWRIEGDLPAGEHAWRWNGETDRGGQAGTGLYFIRLVTPWGTRTERLVRLR